VLYLKKYNTAGTLEGWEDYLGKHSNTSESMGKLGNLWAYLATWRAGKPTWAAIGILPNLYG